MQIKEICSLEDQECPELWTPTIITKSCPPSPKSKEGLEDKSESYGDITDSAALVDIGSGEAANGIRSLPDSTLEPVTATESGKSPHSSSVHKQLSTSSTSTPVSPGNGITSRSTAFLLLPDLNNRLEKCYKLSTTHEEHKLTCFDAFSHFVNSIKEFEMHRANLLSDILRRYSLFLSSTYANMQYNCQSVFLHAEKVQGIQSLTAESTNAMESADILTNSDVFTSFFDLSEVPITVFEIHAHEHSHPKQKRSSITALTNWGASLSSAASNASPWSMGWFDTKRGHHSPGLSPARKVSGEGVFSSPSDTTHPSISSTFSPSQHSESTGAPPADIPKAPASSSGDGARRRSLGAFSTWFAVNKKGSDESSSTDGESTVKHSNHSATETPGKHGKAKNSSQSPLDVQRTYSYDSTSASSSKPPISESSLVDNPRSQQTSSPSSFLNLFGIRNTKRNTPNKEQNDAKCINDKIGKNSLPKTDVQHIKSSALTISRMDTKNSSHLSPTDGSKSRSGSFVNNDIIGDDVLNESPQILGDKTTIDTLTPNAPSSRTYQVSDLDYLPTEDENVANERASTSIPLVQNFHDFVTLNSGSDIISEHRIDDEIETGIAHTSTRLMMNNIYKDGNKSHELENQHLDNNEVKSSRSSNTAMEDLNAFYVAQFLAEIKSTCIDSKDHISDVDPLRDFWTKSHNLRHNTSFGSESHSESSLLSADLAYEMTLFLIVAEMEPSQSLAFLSQKIIQLLILEYKAVRIVGTRSLSMQEDSSMDSANPSSSQSKSKKKPALSNADIFGMTMTTAVNQRVLELLAQMPITLMIIQKIYSQLPNARLSALSYTLLMTVLQLILDTLQTAFHWICNFFTGSSAFPNHNKHTVSRILDYSAQQSTFSTSYIALHKFLSVLENESVKTVLSTLPYSTTYSNSQTSLESLKPVLNALNSIMSFSVTIHTLGYPKRLQSSASLLSSTNSFRMDDAINEESNFPQGNQIAKRVYMQAALLSHEIWNQTNIWVWIGLYTLAEKRVPLPILDKYRIVPMLSNLNFHTLKPSKEYTTSISEEGPTAIAAAASIEVGTIESKNDALTPKKSEALKQKQVFFDPRKKSKISGSALKKHEKDLVLNILSMLMCQWQSYGGCVSILTYCFQQLANVYNVEDSFMARVTMLSSDFDAHQEAFAALSCVPMFQSILNDNSGDGNSSELFGTPSVKSKFELSAPPYSVHKRVVIDSMNKLDVSEPYGDDTSTNIVFMKPQNEEEEGKKSDNTTEAELLCPHEVFSKVNNESSTATTANSIEKIDPCTDVEATSFLENSELYEICSSDGQ